MDYTFLPEKIRSQLETVRPATEHLAVLRGSGGLNGSPGESYLVAYNDAIYLFGKCFGDNDYTLHKILLNEEIPSASFRQEKFSSQLTLRLSSGEFIMKLSVLEGEICARLLSKFATSELDANRTKPDTGQFGPNARSVRLKPLAVLAACMKHIAMIDKQLSPGEERLINAICVNESGWLNLANEYYQMFTFEELIQQTSLDHQQQLCFLANLYELAMVDGVLHTAEQRLIDDFVTMQNLTQSESESVREVLLIKNQLSALT